jgi:hypothetical protein
MRGNDAGRVVPAAELCGGERMGEWATSPMRASAAQCWARSAGRDLANRGFKAAIARR